MNQDNKIVRGFWVGPQLTAIQQLCIKSYQAMGHEVHLYTEGAVTGIPEGTQVHSLRYVPLKKHHDDFICSSHLSDYFRVSLIHELGGWYIDLDTIALKPLDFTEDYVFVSEELYGQMRNPRDPVIPTSEVKTNLINGCIFKAPDGCDFLKYIIQRIENMDTKHLDQAKDWLAVGPGLFREAVPKFNFEKYVQAPVVFDGVSPNQLYHFVSGGVKWDLSPKSYTIHLRTSAWGESKGLSPNKIYPEDSLFEQLKRKHNVQTQGIPGPQSDLETLVQPYTMIGSDKLRLLIDLARRTDEEDIPGDMVECGVCNGGSAAILAHFAAKSRYNRKVHLFDSFEGLPATTKEDLPSANGNTAESEVGKCKGSIDKVKEVLNLVGADMSRVFIHKGWFKDTFNTVDISEISMLNLDSDWYESEKLCLETWYDKVSINGFFYADDYFYWRGSKTAIDEFFARRTNEYPPIFNQVGHAMWFQKLSQEEIIKRRGL